MTLFFERVSSGLKIRLRLTPQGRAMMVDGIMKNSAGQMMLKATVTTAPEDGKANKALLKMLAKEWKVAKSTIEVIQGHTARHKTLHLSGDGENLEKTLTIWATAKGILS